LFADHRGVKHLVSAASTAMLVGNHRIHPTVDRIGEKGTRPSRFTTLPEEV
jgi:hypothetical protein